MATLKKEYLGDSVYAVRWDDGRIVLTTENGRRDDPSNTIYLEPAVIQSLLEFIARTGREES